MCGIVGFTGNAQAAPILLDGLERLEYRGYDSAGIAVKRDDSDKVEIVKVKGRLKQLAEKTDGGRAVSGCCGIGHTRWATHGEPSMQNAHPHFSEGQSVILVHNGIIENYLELKEKLLKGGYTFYSQTDTEVVTKLLDYYYQKCQGNTLDAIVKVMLRVRDYAERGAGSDLFRPQRQSADCGPKRGGQLYCFRCSGSSKIHPQRVLYR